MTDALLVENEMTNALLEEKRNDRCLASRESRGASKRSKHLENTIYLRLLKT